MTNQSSPSRILFIASVLMAFFFLAVAVYESAGGTGGARDVHEEYWEEDDWNHNQALDDDHEDLTHMYQDLKEWFVHADAEQEEHLLHEDWRSQNHNQHEEEEEEYWGEEEGGEDDDSLQETL